LRNNFYDDAAAIQQSSELVTNSMEVACYLRNVENVQPYAVGGNVKSSRNITDSLTNEFVKQFTVDACFAAAAGLSTKGLSTATPEVPSSTKPIMAMQRKITLIEHSKFGVDLFSNMYLLKGLHIITTDEETSQENIDIIQSLGIEVIVAKGEE